MSEMKHVYNCIGHALKVPNVVDAQGVYLVDEHGKKYMDLESGVWCISLGHKNARLNDALSRQCNSLVQSGFSYSNKIVDAAAERILMRVGFAGGKCVFLCSGSEAIEISRQISRHISGHGTSMTLHDSYLGAYSSMSDRRRGWYVFNWNECEGCPSNRNCSRDCGRLRDIPGEISDFVFEPGSASGFVRFPPPSLIRNLADIARENGGKVIVNEITTGIGRTGKWFGYQHYDIEPDLVAMGKGIGNGYPVSVAAINAETIRALRDHPFKYSQSHQNDPLGASVVKEVVDIIEESNLIDEASQKGERFLKKLTGLMDGKILLRVRGRGLMFAVDLCDERTASHIHDELIRRGFIIGHRGSSFRIDPPLTITEDEFDRFLDAFQHLAGTAKVTGETT